MLVLGIVIWLFIEYLYHIVFRIETLYISSNMKTLVTILCFIPHTAPFVAIIIYFKTKNRKTEYELFKENHS